jgi:hypothetical protein
MRTRSLTSLLILTGSTAGLAQVATTPPSPPQNSAAGNPLSNAEDGAQLPDMPAGNRVGPPMGNETIGNNPTAL